MPIWIVLLLLAGFALFAAFCADNELSGLFLLIAGACLLAGVFMLGGVLL